MNQKTNDNNAQTDWGWERLMNKNTEELKRAARGRAVIAYVIAAIFIFGVCLGVFFGYFAALVGAR